ncbi:hypothetical protein HDV57DRAFT_141055 [Trichoderma longibrachiatum]|uniref:Uncharacterized protein n=1 Tax=Trichoderma longibrachiatum ATCC 18648 TaxID=983965 RepID=A0A2T4C6K1_TRILO|nr:hypothetical protein M440DRAFT_1206182 [Trichoderma longibrachiatum ATCC 18648]
MALLLLLFPPQGLPKPSRKNNKGCLTPYSNENAGAAATSSLRAATSTRPVWPSCARFFSVLGLFLVCTQADTGGKLQDGKREERERRLGRAPHGKADPSRCYVARKSRQAEQKLAYIPT